MTLPTHTPGKNPLVLPHKALADAVAAEWEGRKAFNAAAMPLTALAYTAIDRVGDQRDNIVEVLLAYVDTDTLCYRSSDKGGTLAKLQKEQWDPILAWAGSKFSALWQTTHGLMPLEQPAALHKAIKDHLAAMDDMRLAACGILASLCSSLVLALAVVEKRLSAKEAFRLSRLEEDFQAKQWGEDSEAAARANNILKEIEQVDRFLSLLD